MVHPNRQTDRQTEQTNTKRHEERQTDKQAVYVCSAKRFRYKFEELKKLATRTPVKTNLPV